MLVAFIRGTGGQTKEQLLHRYVGPLSAQSPGYLAAGAWRAGRPSGAGDTGRAPRPAPSGTPGCRLREEQGLC